MEKKYPNKRTQQAMEETERLLTDPNTKYYDVEEALLKLKDGKTTKRQLTKRRKSRII